VALQLFSKLQQASMLKVLQTYPTPQAGQAASVEQIAALLKASRHPTPVKTAQHILHTLLQQQLQADAITTRTKARLMLALVVQLLPLIEQIAAYDKEIRAETSPRPA
jgi:transposase